MREIVKLVLIREGTVLTLYLSPSRFQKALPSIMKFLKQVVTFSQNISLLNFLMPLLLIF